MNTSNKKNKDEGHRIGRRIRAKKVRVIDENGNNLGILSIKDALDKASEASMDLVEMSKGEIPTCKILDYGKLKYQESKKEKKKEKKTYEIQLRPKIAEHDICVKIKNAKKFFEKGSNVHFIVQFRGREVVHPETGRVILERVCSELSQDCFVLKNISMQGKKMDMILASKIG